MDFMAYHISNLSNKLEHSLPEKLNISLNETLPRMIVDSLEERLPEMLSDGLNLKLPYFVDDIKKKMPKLIKKALNSNIHGLLKQSLNIVHKDINVLNKLDAQRFFQLAIVTRIIVHKNVMGKILSTDHLPEIVTTKNLIKTVNTTSGNMTELVELLNHIVKGNKSTAPPLSVATKGDNITY
ncbi:hypothetical protein Tco_1474490 [Tanacetum coccineum]